MLKPEAQKLIEEMRKDAISAFNKSDPTLEFKLAGMSVSDGGGEKILSVLDQHFSEFLEANEKLPQEFSVNFSPEDVFNAKIKAQFYLFAERFRPTGGIAIMPSARAQKKAYNDMMEQRALMAAFGAQRCNILLKL